MNSPEYQPNRTPKIVGGVILSAAVVAAVLFFIINHHDEDSAALNTSPATQSQAAGTVASGSTGAGSTNSTATYKDGTYTASSDYNVPGDTNSISITLTVKNGVVAGVNEQDTYYSGQSARYISYFKSNISSEVVGRSLGDAQVTRVSGASDTSAGFSNAVTKIISQAKA